MQWLQKISYLIIIIWWRRNSSSQGVWMRLGMHANSLFLRLYCAESIFRSMQTCLVELIILNQFLCRTKDAILEFITKENTKCSELRRNIIDPLASVFLIKERFRRFQKKVGLLPRWNKWFLCKISQASKLLKSEQDPILGLLSLSQLNRENKKIRLIP
ncbi:unnamed protein product [Blepharisma stoltei]|uniref:Maturase n=1 Tax=Blepharisma stoltei TaxID=1481888 RepID=A0AAU9K9R5_9CILI|nr:unnamed protein product [Blepharisma stoltei]